MTRELQDTSHDIFPLPNGEYYPYHSASKTISCAVEQCRKGNCPSVTMASRNARVCDNCNYSFPLWITGQVFQTSLTVPPQTDGRTSANNAPEPARRLFAAPLGEVAAHCRETYQFNQTMTVSTPAAQASSAFICRMVNGVSFTAFVPVARCT